MKEFNTVRYGRVDIPRFLDAYTYSEEKADRFMNAYFSWIEAYDEACLANEYLAEIDKESFDYIETGKNSRYYAAEADRYMIAAFHAINSLDKVYVTATKNHIKGWVNSKDLREIRRFMIRFHRDYDAYMSGGHEDVVVAVA